MSGKAGSSDAQVGGGGGREDAEGLEAWRGRQHGARSCAPAWGSKLARVQKEQHGLRIIFPKGFQLSVR